MINIDTNYFKGYFSTNPNHGSLSSNNIVSLSYCASNRELIVSTDSGVDHLYGGTGELEHPENLRIEMIADSVYLEWDSVPYADSYMIYSSTLPYPEILIYEGVSFTTTWSCKITSETKKFYYVKAVN